jgi:hypothetical protein
MLLLAWTMMRQCAVGQNQNQNNALRGQLTNNAGVKDKQTIIKGMD